MAAEAEPGTSDAPTKQRDLTKEQAIIGTLQYMAPEQLEGKTADARADIFAFGAVLYEMLTGKKAFEGESQASLITSIMSSKAPSVSEHKPLSPAVLDHVVETCLAKDPVDRWQTAGDVRRQLEWIAEADVHAGVEPSRDSAPRKVTHLTIGFAMGTIAAALLLGIVMRRPTTTPAATQPTRFAISLPPTQQLENVIHRRSLALSPNGRQIVYVANEELYLRDMDKLQATRIRGTDEGASEPFFSPDGEWIGYRAGGMLKKISIAGGVPITLCDRDCGSGGASWGRDDTIVFSRREEGLWQVSASGGVAQVLVAGDGIHWLVEPQLLPNGEAILFSRVPAFRWNEAQVVVQSLVTGERQILVGDGTDGHYVPTGHLVYALNGTLMAVPLEIDPLQVGKPGSDSRSCKPARCGRHGAIQLLGQWIARLRPKLCTGNARMGGSLRASYGGSGRSGKLHGTSALARRETAGRWNSYAGGQRRHMGLRARARHAHPTHDRRASNHSTSLVARRDADRLFLQQVGQYGPVLEANGWEWRRRCSS
ncbi:MAG: hypothetical protein E2P02_23040 [Acidobacteria bacterium]|nr:MAG: hypothetical protein E2P02_23040 [Acidobacteriota bacterium]